MVGIKKSLKTISVAFYMGFFPQLFASQFAEAQTKKITGTVIDSESDQALKKATINIKFKEDLENIVDSLQTFTNDSGKFEIEIPPLYQDFDFTTTHVGYDTTVIKNFLLNNNPSQIFIHLNPILTNIGEILVSPPTFSKVVKLDPKKDITLDEKLNETLTQDYSKFYLADITTVLKKFASVKAQSEQFSPNIYIQGGIAPVTLDEIPLINSSKLGVLGGPSPNTFSLVTACETYIPGGKGPGSIQIYSKNKPTKGKNSKIYVNPIIREIYTETKVGENFFVFVDGYKMDNSFLQYFQTELVVPNFKSLESKLTYSKNRLKEFSVYGIFSEGNVGENTNQSGIKLQTKDKVIISTFDSQLNSFMGLKYPKFKISFAYQTSSMGVKNPNETLDIRLKREKINFFVAPTFFFNFGNLKTRVSFQKDYLKLSGDFFGQMDLGDGGGGFSQSFDNLLLGETKNIFSIFTGLEKEKTTINLEYKNISGKSAWSSWAEFKSKIISIPFFIGLGYIQDFPSNMDFLEKRAVIKKNSKIQQEQTWYSSLKLVKELESGVLFEAGCYKNWARTNRLREPDARDIIEYNLKNSGILNLETLIRSNPGILLPESLELDKEKYLKILEEMGTLDFWNLVKNNPEELIPEPTFCLLKDERVGAWARVSSPSGKLAKLTADIHYEDVVTFIPPREYFKKVNNIPSFVNYRGQPVKNPAISGLSAFLETNIDLIKSPIKIPIGFNGKIKYFQGRPYVPENLVPLVQEYNGDTIAVATIDGKQSYLKQKDYSAQSRYPSTWDIDLSLEFNPSKDTKIFFFIDNLFNHNRIVSTVYNEEYGGIFSNGESWKTQENYRFFGAGFEMKF